MTAALERVIAEQQAVIDMLKKREDAHILSCIQQVDAERKLGKAVLNYMGNTKSIDAWNEVRMTLINQGWCLTCENSPCECYE